MVAERIGYHLKRTCYALRSQMDHTLRTLQLTTPKYAALCAIEEYPGSSGNRIARRCFVTAQTMNLILVSLEKAGLIERHPHPEYRRVLQTYLTPEGKRILQESHHKILSIEEAMLAGLAEDEQHQLLQLLHSCAIALGKS
ncbi:DNA-binding MarR family transcriptional regulator [Thermosporothrix hazakensis]|uniref:DNA-binding MarR family transcriptional regulator n=2 Tax=Thermosporothrix TaxID=768650 RepID=A0A326U8E5_THEHA|nr:MarR family transcriptional regulator [Thermosporothrix hazakensis]PZW31905.1 DNA-binding MarR family transcriptional regulator [Thermosporothrix hazakensis]